MIMKKIKSGKRNITIFEILKGEASLIRYNHINK